MMHIFAFEISNEILIVCSNSINSKLDEDMKELICPNCHKAFKVDEADYASIVNQVKNAEFNAEVDRRIAELHDRHKAEEQLAAAKAEKSY